jgi:hypothetical protein
VPQRKNPAPSPIGSEPMARGVPSADHVPSIRLAAVAAAAAAGAAAVSEKPEKQQGRKKRKVSQRNRLDNACVEVGPGR